MASGTMVCRLATLPRPVMILACRSFCVTYPQRIPALQIRKNALSSPCENGIGSELGSYKGARVFSTSHSIRLKSLIFASNPPLCKNVIIGSSQATQHKCKEAVGSGHGPIPTFCDTRIRCLSSLYTSNRIVPHGGLWKRSYSSKPVLDADKSSFRGIQNDASLVSKRAVRRKKSNDDVPKEQECFDVIAFATAEEFNLEALRDDITRQGLYRVVKLPEDAFDALHIEARYLVNKEPREVFFFREGSVVFWNVQDEEQETLLDYVRPFQSGAYDSMLTKEELEKFEFVYTENKTVFTNGEIHLQLPVTSDDRLDQQLEMFAFSNGLSLSVKLAIWEASLEKYVDSIEFVLQDLKNGKKIQMSEAEVLKKAGELFTLSHMINLSSDLLDTPDFYWDRDYLEKFYIKTCNHLNISRRTKVMNEKLSQCVELTELLRDHLKDKHHTRLELMIIFLILIEVVFQIFHLFEKYYLEADGKGVDEKKLQDGRHLE